MRQKLHFLGKWISIVLICVGGFLVFVFYPYNTSKNAKPLTRQLVAGDRSSVQVLSWKTPSWNLKVDENPHVLALDGRVLSGHLNYRKPIIIIGELSIEGTNVHEFYRPLVYPGYYSDNSIVPASMPQNVETSTKPFNVPKDGTYQLKLRPKEMGQTNLIWLKANIKINAKSPDQRIINIGLALFFAGLALGFVSLMLHREPKIIWNWGRRQ